MATTPKNPTPPSAATLAKKLKAAEAKLAVAEQAIIEFNKLNANERADYGNGQYSLGYAEGLRDGQAQTEATYKAQSYITRLLKR